MQSNDTNTRAAIQCTVQQVIGDSSIHMDTALMDAGVDSLLAVEFRNRLRSELAVSIPATVVFDYPTIAALAQHLSSLSGETHPYETPRHPLHADSDSASVAGPVKVTGIANRFPGQSSSQDAFAAALSAGSNCVSDIPLARWDHDAYYDPDPDSQGRAYTMHGSFIQGVDQYDPRFFGISNFEA
jgi:acyl carrier protein